MFGSNKVKETQGSISHNSLVKDCVVVGNMSSSTDIRIDGTINGDLRCDAKLVLGANGVINGNVYCQNALVEGKVNGDISCKQVLDIRKTAQLEGNIESTKLIVEDGALFNGVCKMISASAITPTHGKGK